MAKESNHLGIEEIGRAEGCFLHQDRADDQAHGHAGKAEEQHGVGDALQGVERGQPVERRPPGVFAGLHFAFEAALLHQIKDRGQQAESQARRRRPAAPRCGR